MCGAAVVQATAAMAGGAGVETEMSCRIVLSGARVFVCCVVTCRQQRLPTWTGGRLHPGLAGERLLKQSPFVGCLEDVGIAGFAEGAFGIVFSCA